MNQGLVEIVLLVALVITVILFVHFDTQAQVAGVRENTNWLMAKQSFSTVKFDGNTESSIVGSYLYNTGIILVVDSSRSNRDLCLTFLHELGHKVSEDSNKLNVSEDSAEAYKNANAFRCDGI